MGLIIDAKYFKGTPKDIHQTSGSKSILRFLLLLLIYTPIIFLMIVTNEKFTYLPVRMSLYYFIPTLFLSLILFGYSKLLFAKLGLLDYNN